MRLLGHYSSQAAAGRPAARDLAILLHGWEGSADSLYVLSLGSYLFSLGCDVFRLNFRDHGPSHHLNEDIFHSCRLDEVVGAVRRIQQTLPQRRLTIAGFSLGGNFALRVASARLQRGCASSARSRSVRCCARTARWTCSRTAPSSITSISSPSGSARCAEAELFPQRYDFAAILAQRSIKTMTEMLVERYSEFPGSGCVPERLRDRRRALASLEVPSHILFSLDDPIIPARDLQDLARGAHLQINTLPHGGHCGFMDSLDRESWADRQVARFMGLQQR